VREAVTKITASSSRCQPEAPKDQVGTARAQRDEQGPWWEGTQAVQRLLPAAVRLPQLPPAPRCLLRKGMKGGGNTTRRGV